MKAFLAAATQVFIENAIEGAGIATGAIAALLAWNVILTLLK